jgi:hypothetical protein
MEYGEFLLTMMHSSTNTQILHRQTKSYAEHKALRRFYEEIIPLVDQLSEVIQGLEGEIIEYPVDYYGPASSGLEELMSLKEYVAEERKELPDNSEVQNIVDEIAALIDSTVYKLKFLK